jgi:hypothetical protein
MLRKYIVLAGICLLGIFITTNVYAQQLNMDVRDFDGNMQVYDPANPSKSKGAKLSYAEVEGSAFWSDQWNPAIIFFNNGGKAKINQTKLNLYTGEIHYLSNDGTELVVENEGVVRLIFVNKNNLTQPIASFAKLMNHTTGNGAAFYKVLNAGLYQLILLQKQLVKTSPYDPIQGKSISSFYSKKDYAIYNEGKVIPLRDLDRASILAAIPLNSLTESWLKTSKSKLKSEKEVTDYLEQVNLSYLAINGNIK